MLCQRSGSAKRTFQVLRGLTLKLLSYKLYVQYIYIPYLCVANLIGTTYGTEAAVEDVQA